MLKGGVVAHFRPNDAPPMDVIRCYFRYLLMERGEARLEKLYEIPMRNIMYFSLCKNKKKYVVFRKIPDLSGFIISV